MTQTPQPSPYDAEIAALEVGYWSVKANIRRITTLRDKREGYLDAMEVVKELRDLAIFVAHPGGRTSKVIDEMVQKARAVLARIFDNTL